MDYTHHDTPKKAQLRGTISFLESERIPYFKSHVFRHFDIPRRSGYRVLAEENARRHHNDPDVEEKRGRKLLLSSEDVQAMEKLIWDHGYEARTLTWTSLLHAAGIEKTCHTRTVQRAMGTLDYRKCIACPKRWVSQASAQKRVEYAQIMRKRYPKPEDWRHVRFSNEIHFGFGPQGKVRIIRRLGERYCPDCLQEQRLPAEKDLKRLYAWAAVGYNLTAHRLKSYFNCPQSPDLVPIENAWSAPKEWIAQFDSWDNDSLQSLAIEGWNRLTQDTINSWVDSIPQRLDDCVESGGKITGW